MKYNEEDRMKISEKLSSEVRVLREEMQKDAIVNPLVLVEFEDKDGNPIFVNRSRDMVGAIEKDKDPGQTKIHLMSGKVIVKGEPSEVKAILLSDI
jgi:hypothetical protein